VTAGRGKGADPSGGAYSVPQVTQLSLRGPTYKAPNYKAREKREEVRGAKMIYAPGCQKPSRRHC